jgi:hypothetical protein
VAVAKSAYGVVGSGWGFAERRAPAATPCINLDAMFSCSTHTITHSEIQDVDMVDL